MTIFQNYKGHEPWFPCEKCGCLRPREAMFPTGIQGVGVCQDAALCLRLQIASAEKALRHAP